MAHDSHDEHGDATPTHPDEMFNAARRLSDPAERGAYLDSACAGDAGLRQRVDALLAAYEQAASFLESPAAGMTGAGDVGAPGATLEPATPAEQLGATIGRYKLLERIGEGGFGVVYMAEQHHPVRRKVALKVIKPGLDTRQVIARFEAERQALALMNHENIAKVFDAGATDSGRPYFVMELVHGVPITEYCDKNQLAPRERLALFVQVCRAVQHAHTKGIIHRDIKPTNVLVTLHEGTAVPKVIDFGIAKAAGQQLTDKTLFTNFQQMVGTPLYMSPEQAEMTGVDVDTRSDVYSLGVLLYELLTGTTPVDKERLKRAAFDEVRRIIRDEEPPRPSTRLSTMGELARSVCASRKSDPRQLGRLVRGELDWIVMKALEKERSRRYETANGFAADVQRYLEGESVQAVPPSAAYRLRKFARRNKVALAAGLAVSVGLVLAVVALAVTNLWVARQRDEKANALRDREGALREKDGALVAARESEARAVKSAERADEERRRAESYFLKARIAIREILTNAANGQGQWATLPPAFRKNLADEVLRFYQGFVSESATDATLRYETGWAYQGIGLIHLMAEETEQAEAYFRRSVGVLGPLVAEFPDVAEYSQQLAWAHVTLGRRLMAARRLDEAEVSFRRATELYDAAGGTMKFEDEAAQARRGLVQVLQAAGRGGEVGKLHEQRVKDLEKRAAATPGDAPLGHQLAQAYEALAEVRDAQRRAKEAEALRRQALPLWERLVQDHPAEVNYRWWLADTYRNLGLLDKALAELDRALEHDGNSASGWNLRGIVHFGLKRPDLAAADFTKAIELNPQNHVLWSNRAALRRELGQADGALADAAKALELRPDLAAFRRAVETHPENAAAHCDLGIRLRAAGNLDEAIACLRKALQLNPKHVDAHLHLGHALRDQGKLDEALARYDEALRLDPDVANAQAHRARLLASLGRFREAAVEYGRAVGGGSGDNFDWWALALLHAYLGNADAYRDVCSRALTRFEGSEDGVDLERASRACLLLPPPTGVDPARPAAMARRAMAGDPSHPWYQLSAALAEYRLGLGHFEAAVRLIDGARPAIVNGNAELALDLLRAMTLHRMGRAAEARAALVDAAGRADRKLAKPGDARFDDGGVDLWLLVQVLRKEAEALLGPVTPQELASLRRQALDLELAGLTRAAEQHPGSPNAMAARAQWLLSHGRFEEAERDYGRLVELHPVEHGHWYYRGCLLAYLGREPEYREHYRAMLKHFADSQDKYVLDRTTKTALLLPGGDDADAQRLLESARTVRAMDPDEPWFDLLVGMAEHRAGAHAAAVPWLEKSRSAEEAARTAAAEAFLAMAYHRLGRAADAQGALARCAGMVERDLPKAGVDDLSPAGAENWLIAHIALREAEATVLGRPRPATAPAPATLPAAVPPLPPTPSAPSPFGKTPAALPGTVQAEDFDKGGEGVAYHDTTHQNFDALGEPAATYRLESVDLEPSSDAGGGFHVAGVRAGEWLSYTVEVKEAGRYDLSLRVCSPGGGRLHVEFGGKDVTGPVEVPKTGWNNWATVAVKDVPLGAGPQAMRVVFDAAAAKEVDVHVCNLNWIEARRAR